MMLFQAVEDTVQALRDAGRIEQVDTAIVTACLMLAAEIDGDVTNDRLWREFRQYEQALRLVGVGREGDTVDRLLAVLSSEVRDPSDS